MKSQKRFTEYEIVLIDKLFEMVSLLNSCIYQTGEILKYKIDEKCKPSDFDEFEARFYEMMNNDNL